MKMAFCALKRKRKKKTREKKTALAVHREWWYIYGSACCFARARFWRGDALANYFFVILCWLNDELFNVLTNESALFFRLCWTASSQYFSSIGIFSEFWRPKIVSIHSMILHFCQWVYFYICRMSLMSTLTKHQQNWWSIWQRRFHRICWNCVNPNAVQFVVCRYKLYRTTKENIRKKFVWVKFDWNIYSLLCSNRKHSVDQVNSKMMNICFQL